MNLPHALFFDMDGVIIDTEKDGHRVAFNKTFEEFDLDVFWDIAYYGELIKIAGGKERMRHHFETSGFGKAIDASEVDTLIVNLHRRKTEIFIELIQGGSLELRPGIHRLMKEANDADVPICICTTATQKAAEAVAAHSLPDIRFAHILAGDIVTSKKPAPDIYLLALEKTGTDAARCFVIEDSRNGMLAGHRAGANVAVTTSVYTREENFVEAALVVSCLGDTDGEQGSLIQGNIDGYNGILNLDILGAHIS